MSALALGLPRQLRPNPRPKNEIASDPVDSPKDLTRSMARKCFEAAAGDRAVAEVSLRQELMGNLKVRGALADLLVENFCSNLIRQMAHEENVRIESAARRVAPNGDDGSDKKPWSIPANTGVGMAAHRLMNETVFAWQLPGGKKIGDATRTDLEDAIAYWRARIGTDNRHIRIVTDLIKQMRLPQQPVREAVSETELSALFSAAGVKQ